MECELTLLTDRLDQSSLILRGEPDESPSALLKGTLVLCLSEPLKVQGIHLRFTGEAKVEYVSEGAAMASRKMG